MSELSTLLDSSISGIAVLIGGGVVTLVRKRRSTAKDDIEDMGNLTDFLFDKPSNPRTRTPATTGWTTMVNATLEDHGRRLADIGGMVQQVLAEVKPDGNGGHNLRGAVVRSAKAADEAREAAERAVQAAQDEAQLQVEERERVARREASRE